MSESKGLAEPTGPFQGGLGQLLDLNLVTITEQEVVAELVVSAKHHQPMGIVHGGVYCALVETVCSVGAFVHASKRSRSVVGVDNQTSFLKATRTGTLRAVGKPLSIGGRTQLWEANIFNEEGALVSTGRVRLLALEAGAPLAGGVVGKLGLGTEPPKG
jgi:1,4-dihydroxy-2-naphthoyl-CoA hydrolase